MSVITHAFAARPGVSYNVFPKFYLFRYFKRGRHHLTISQKIERWLEIKLDLVVL